VPHADFEQQSSDLHTTEAGSKTSHRIVSPSPTDQLPASKPCAHSGTTAVVLRGVQPLEPDELLPRHLAISGPVIAVLPLMTWLLWSWILQAFGFDRTGVP
jgi:hypothetical protein